MDNDILIRMGITPIPMNIGPIWSDAMNEILRLRSELADARGITEAGHG